MSEAKKNRYIELIPEKGNFYKVNLHCHTDISDGKMTAEEIKALYKAQGYSAVCFTDHELLVSHRELCDDSFIALEGYEVCIKKNLEISSGYFQPLYHFNFISKSQGNEMMPKFFKDHPNTFGNSRKMRENASNYIELIDHTEYNDEWLNAYLKDVVDRGFIVNYNHPQWSLQTRDDYINLKNIHSIEVINGVCSYLNDNTALHYEQMLRADMRVCPTAGDDTHKIEDIGRAWTMIKAPEFSYSALIQAYDNGHCYASEGPEIRSLVLDGDKIKVETSPASAIVLLGEGRSTQVVASRTETYTKAEFDYIPEKLGSYFRIEVRDRFGYKAYSNAYFMSDIEAGRYYE